MAELATLGQTLPASSPRAKALVDALEARCLEQPQPRILTHHVLHGGIYTRTMCLPAGHVLTSTLVKIPTTLTVCGDAAVVVGDGEVFRVQGYQVLAACRGRQVAYRAYADTWMSMAFVTKAHTVEEAEAEFTDEPERLMSRFGENIVVNTGE